MPTAVTEKIKTNFNFLQPISKAIKTFFAYLTGKRIHAQFYFLQQSKNTLKTDFRYIQPSMSGSLTTSYISAEEITLYLDSVQITDHLINSVRMTFNADDMSILEFDLTRKFDNLDYTESGTYSQISANNEVKVYIKGSLLWTFYIIEIQTSFIEEKVHIMAQGDEYTYNKNLVTLDMPSLNEQLNAFHVLINDVDIQTPIPDVDDLNTQFFNGIKINLGTTILESVYQEENFLLTDIEDISPEQNYTYFWYVEGENFVTGDSFFPAKYIGTSLSPTSSDTFNISGVRWKKQRGVFTTAFTSKYLTSSITNISIGTGTKSFSLQTYYLAYKHGQAVRITHDASNYMEGTVNTYNSSTSLLSVHVTLIKGNGSHNSWTIDLIANDTSTFYYLGTAPYKEVSTKNGEYVSVWHWEDREDGLYQGVNSYYNFKPWAQAYANNEFVKMKNINGTLFPQTSASISITLDAFMYYGLKLLQRINIGNTTQSNIYKNSNGFPLSIKGIIIDMGNMKVDITANNSWAQSELIDFDNALGDEPIESSGVFFKIANKYDLSRQEDIS